MATYIVLLNSADKRISDEVFKGDREGAKRAIVEALKDRRGLVTVRRDKIAHA